MSYADKVFVDTCNKIINEGTSNTKYQVRTKWEDGTPAYTQRYFGITNRYDLTQEFPAITLRNAGIKNAYQEIRWIYQMKSNNVNDLGLHIWDSWTDNIGSIGRAYGYQVGHQMSVIKSVEGVAHYNREMYENKYKEEYPSALIKRDMLLLGGKGNKGRAKDYEYFLLLDQMDKLLYELKHDPFSRRHIIDLWNNEELHLMNLQPCCWNLQFMVEDVDDDKLHLNMVLTQRSNDVLAANAWNVCQYAVLLMMVAQVSDMKPGYLLHSIADAHIYDRHIDVVKELITREQYPAPTVTLNPDVKDFYKFTKDDITVENYKYGKQVKFEVAI